MRISKKWRRQNRKRLKLSSIFWVFEIFEVDGGIGERVDRFWRFHSGVERNVFGWCIKLELSNTEADLGSVSQTRKHFFFLIVSKLNYRTSLGTIPRVFCACHLAARQWRWGILIFSWRQNENRSFGLRVAVWFMGCRNSRNWTFLKSLHDVAIIEAASSTFDRNLIHIL